MIQLYNTGTPGKWHYICANSHEEAKQISQIIFKRRMSKHFGSAVVHTLYETIGKSFAALDIIENFGTGYFDCEKPCVYNNEINFYEFTPFNVRSHYIDKALEIL